MATVKRFRCFKHLALCHSESRLWVVCGVYMKERGYAIGGDKVM